MTADFSPFFHPVIRRTEITSFKRFRAPKTFSRWLLVRHLNGELRDPLVFRGGLHRGLGDVDVGGLQGAGDIGQEARLVNRNHLNFNGVELLGPAGPVPLRRNVAEGLGAGQIGTVGPMDGHPLAAGDVAHDGVAGDGLAAVGQPHQQIIQVLDFEAGRFFLAPLRREFGGDFLLRRRGVQP